jgi:hypothetical protein
MFGSDSVHLLAVKKVASRVRVGVAEAKSRDANLTHEGDFFELNVGGDSVFHKPSFTTNFKS